MVEPFIRVEAVEFIYPDGTPALKGVSAGFAAGERIALVGRNGSGKTTLAKHLNGLLKPTRGRVLVNENDTRKVTVAQVARRVGYVFQNPGHQIFSQTVEEEVAFGLKYQGFSKAEINAKVDATLEVAGIASQKQSHPLFLTLAEKQLVAIASCIILEPSVLILDEPTSCLDLVETTRILNLLHLLHNDGKTIILITHDMRLASEEVDRVIAMESGSIIFDGSPRDIFTQSEILARASLRMPQVAELCQLMFPGEPLALSVEELVGRVREEGK
jgi:energy-coupling factor transporter ATP-binding protein EcfA2